MITEGSGEPPAGAPVIRVLLVDDEQLVRSGLRMILESAGDIEVVGEAVDGGARSSRCGGTARTPCSWTSACRPWMA